MASVGVAVAIFGSERTDTPWLFVTLVLFEGWAWIAAGLVALARRPDTPAGLWMIAAGFSWMWGALEFANPDVLETLGAAFAGTLFPFILHVLVGFPTSVRLTGAARALLVVAWGTWIVTALTFALWPLGRDGCETCSREVFPVAPGTPGSEVLSVLGNGVGALFVAAAVLVVAKRHRALPAGHRGQDEAAAAVIGAGVVITAVIALDVLARTVVPSLERATVAALFAMSLIAPVAFVVALVRERLTLPARVAHFLRQLDRSTTSPGLERALADALGDDEARLGFWIPERRGYVDIAGRPIEPAELGAATPIVRDGEPLGILVQGQRSTSDPELVRTLAAAASIEVERSRLEAQLRARVDELRASRARVIEAADEARRRLERDLHDGAQQRFVAAAIGLRVLRAQIDREAPSAVPLLDEVLEELQGALGDLRELAQGLHPSVLTELGLGEALKAAAMRSPIPAQVLAAPDERLPPLLESTAYFVACEALANAAKHSGASRITVRAACEGAVLVVEVADDGAGGATSTGGSGLRGLEDRAGALDGRVTVVSPPGAGTLVRAELPLDGGGQDGGKPDGRVAAGMAPSGAWR